MRTIGVFILLLLLGCGFVSFFALDRSMMTLAPTLHPAVIIVTEGDSTQMRATQPVDDPILLTATGIIREATERVLLMTNDPTALAITKEIRLATEEELIAEQTTYPNLPVEAIYATQFTLTQAANPDLTATIQGCRSNSVFDTTNEPFADILSSALETHNIPLRVEYRIRYYTADCINYNIQSAHLYLSYYSEQVPEFDLNQLADELMGVLLDEDLSIYRIDKFGLLVQVYAPVDRAFSYYYGVELPFDDFRANYEDGLRGLNLFLPRGD